MVTAQGKVHGCLNPFITAGPRSLELQRAIYYPGRRNVKEETSAFTALLLY